MSEVDRSNVQNEERQRLVNHSGQENEQQQNQAKAKKKKIMIGVGILVAIGVILAIVLPLSLRNKGDDDNSDPYSYQEYNPYTVDPETWDFSVYKGEFIMKTKEPVPKPPSDSKFMSLRDDGVTNKDYKPVNPKDIPIGQINNVGTDEVRFNIDMVDNFNVRVLIQDNHNLGRGLVSEEVFPRPVLSWEARLTQVGFQTTNDTFSFSLNNIYTRNTIITTQKRKLFVSDKFSEIGFVLPTQRCYGLGQRNGQFQLQHGTYTLHSRFREAGIPEDDSLGGKNGNHIHPFILCQTTDKDFFGMFFVSTSPQTFEVIQFGGDKRMVLNYITLGGPIEIYTIVRGKAEEIISKYHKMIGYSAMPPYYALGFYQGSNTYNSLAKVKNVVENFQDTSVALEGIFLTNYNQKPHQTFTISEQFKGLTDYIAQLHGGNQRIILGTSLAIQGNYEIFEKTIQYKCLVDSLQAGKQVIGILDQTQVYYIDPFHEGTQPFFEETLPEFYRSVGKFDGLQIQDSYLPNHITGEIDQSPPEPTTAEKRMLLSEESIGTYAPYKINKDQSEYSLWNLPFDPVPEGLYYLSIPLNSSQGGGEATPKVRNYFIHNANSHRTLQKVNATWEDLDIDTNTRPLLFSDSSWVGSGAFGIALITDMQRTWTNLRGLIAQAMQMSLFGMSNTMVDGCGSLGKLDEELCARWMQVSAFLPMFRGYYNETYLDSTDNKRKETEPSEFWNFKNFDYQAAYTSAIAQRLPFTRYIYSQLYYCYRVGAALVKPLFYDYPEDDQTFLNTEHTFMLGDSIKVSPVLEQGVKDGDHYFSYFPEGYWYDLNEPKLSFNLSQGGYVELTARDTHTNIHLKGGKIIPYQQNTNSYKTTRDFETNLRMSFKVARDKSQQYAEGYLLIDDGISADSYDIGPENKQKFTFWKLRYAQQSINFWVEYGDFTYEPPEDYQIHYLESIEILSATDLNETDFACYLGLNLQPTPLDFDYNPYTETFTIKPTQENPNVKINEIGFIKFGSTAKGDQNFCDPSSFQYNTDDSDTTDPHQWIFNISSTYQGLKPLVAVFQQLDDIGTINLEITTKEDYEAGKTIIYRVPDKIVYDTETHFPKKADLKRKLSDFLKVKESPFQYSLYKDTLDESTKVWSSDPTRLYFSKYFVMDSGVFDMNPDVDQPLMGMGERAGSLFYKNENGGIHSRYTYDQANPIDDGLPPGRNMYGYQPFYAFQSSIKDTKDWFGVFDMSSYATDYIIFSSNENKQTQIHKITIGGTINKFFFIGEKPDDIIKTYSKLVGFPTVPPLWAFGWHQCRFGYITDEDWFNVYQQYKANDLPLDGLWGDIDYMDDYKSFTISQESYPNLPELVDIIKEDGIQFIPNVNPGVAVRENQDFKAFDLGIEMDVFIKQANKKDPLTAGVWCGNAYFPDFFKPEAVEWWKTMFTDFYDSQGLHFDGVWLDENEATNFCDGYCITEERPNDSLRNKPFYVPGWRDLEDQALGVDGWHDSIERYEYDVHNLYSLMQSKATAEFLISQKKRPYILTRSNQPGIGKYAHHWMGDNWSTIEYMQISVDGIYSYNLFALPFMGSDICGFNGDAAPDLCTRWHILGSLYPFARNHNQNATTSQEPYVFNQTVPGTTDTKYVDIMRNALVNRYSFIKYYYSAFYMLAQEGGSFFKPLFYEFPLDPKAFIDIETNILLGDALKLSMETTTLDFETYPSRQYYFPKGRWCRILPPVEDPAKDCFDSDGGADGYQTFPSTLDSYYIHLRNGYILPYQDAQANKVRKTLDLEKFPTDLYILQLEDNVPMTLSKTVSAVARGFVIFDDGVSPLPNPHAKFEFYMVKNDDDNTFTLTFDNVGDLTKSKEPKQHENLGDIHIMWASKSGLDNVTKVTINYGEQQTADLDFNLDNQTDILTISVTTDKDSYLFWDITEIIIQ